MLSSPTAVLLAAVMYCTSALIWWQRRFVLQPEMICSVPAALPDANGLASFAPRLSPFLLQWLPASNTHRCTVAVTSCTAGVHC